MEVQSRLNWFIETTDPKTIEIMASQLVAPNQLDEKITLEDSKGISRKVYFVVGRGLVTKVIQYKKKLDLNFKVYYRKSNIGPIRLWTFNE